MVTSLPVVRPPQQMSFFSFSAKLRFIFCSDQLFQTSLQCGTMSEEMLQPGYYQASSLCCILTSLSWYHAECAEVAEDVATLKLGTSRVVRSSIQYCWFFSLVPQSSFPHKHSGSGGRDTASELLRSWCDPNLCCCLCEVCTFSLWLPEFPLGAPALSHITKMWRLAD